MGTVSTLIATQLLKSIGKVYYYFKDFNIEYSKYDTGGVHVKSSLEEAEYCDIEFKIQIFNNAENPKNIKDIGLMIQTKNKDMILSLHNYATGRHSGGGTRYDTIDYLNLLPKQFYEYNLKASVDKENIKYLHSIDKIYFIANNYKNKKIRKLLK